MKKYNQPQTEITQVGTYSLLQAVSLLDLKYNGQAPGGSGGPIPQ
jgi:hypothetical protein